MTATTSPATPLRAGVPVDADARRVVTEELGRTVFVEAGAGAGKTSELVRRIVNLVSSGVPITKVAAITFTEKAAAELRDRVRLALEARLVDVTGEADIADLARLALERLDEAHIQTLHGFAQSLLAAHAIAAKLPPVFEVIDEVEAGINFDRRWAPLLDDLLSLDARAELMTVAMNLGMTVDRLRDLAQQFHQRWDLLDTGELPAAPLLAPDFIEIAERAALVLAARSSCRDPDDRLCAYIDGPVADFVSALVIRPDLVHASRLLGDDITLVCTHGRRENWPVISKAEVAGRLNDLRQARDAARVALASPVLEHVCRLMQEFTLAGVAERRADGRLEFQDLLVLARDLLRDHRAVRATVRADLSHLLIDEFQDTDPLQVELAVLIAGVEEPGGEPPPWDEAQVGQGRLFFVGDPKQSIYRFRGADIALYQKVRGRFSPDVVMLAQNFRSVPGLLAWVNDVFAGLFADGSGRAGTGGQAPWAALEPYRAGIAGHAPVVVLGEPVTGLAQAGVRSLEAAAVAEACRQAVREPWFVGDGERGRRAEPDDIAVLLPTRASLAALERAFDAIEMPYRVESRSLLWATQEIRDVLALLRAVDDPSDQVALVAALRSPALACPDRGLVEWRAAGGHWDPLALPPETLSTAHPVAEAMAYLRSVHADRWRTPVSVLVDRVVRERGMFELAYGRRRQRETWHRLRFFLDQARAFADRGGAGLRPFLDWAERQADEGSAVVETVVPEADDRAVRILTVHAAKGLEFPIVVVAGLNTVSRRWRPAEVLWQEHGPPAVSVGTKNRPWFTEGYLDQRQTEIALEQAEALRLLYVACTRARDHLVVSLYHKAERDDPGACLAARLMPHASRTSGLSRRLVMADGRAGTVAGLEAAGAALGAASRTIGADGSVSDATREGSKPALPEPARFSALLRRQAVHDDLSAWRAERAELLKRLGREPAMAATALGALAAAAGVRSVSSEAPPSDLFGASETVTGEGLAIAGAGDLSADDLSPWRRGRAGSAFGRAVHAVLQSVDLASGAGIDVLADAQAAAEGIGERGPEIARSAWAALGSQAVREAVSGRWWREVYVAADLGRFVIDGYIDLLYESPRGLVVVDYKTDALPDEGLDSAAERYRIQVAVYAIAVERTVGRPVVGGELVFTRGSGSRQRTVGDLEKAKLEVMALVAALRPPK